MIYLGFCIIILTTYIGYCFSKNLAKRKKFFNDFYNFNQKIKREVGFSKNTLLSILDEENEFVLLLKKVVFESEIERPKYLEKEDFELFINYGKFLGTSDSDSQISYFNSLNDGIKKLLEEAKQKEEKLRPLYLKLGFFIGLALLIILL
ncbi:MAG: hypothetical protein E7342_02490 [Clostridiales bacterium]|nr:hypothetical protein [Clostridiales bacterium]